MMETSDLRHVPRDGQPESSECGKYISFWPTADYRLLRSMAEAHRVAGDDQEAGYCSQCIAALKRARNAR
jgi:hypothetical protein